VKVDLVHDDVQKNLIKEVETINGVQQMLTKTLDQTTEQIRSASFLCVHSHYNYARDILTKKNQC